MFVNTSATLCLDILASLVCAAIDQFPEVLGCCSAQLGAVQGGAVASSMAGQAPIVAAPIAGQGELQCM